MTFRRYMSELVPVEQRFVVLPGDRVWFRDDVRPTMLFVEVESVHSNYVTLGPHLTADGIEFESGVPLHIDRVIGVRPDGSV